MMNKYYFMPTHYHKEPHIDFALKMHANQRRANGDAYVIHPLSVMERVREFHLSKDIEVAAVLHDVMENCNVQAAEIAARFGNRVAYIITSLSKDPKADFPSNREGYKMRITHYLKRLEKGVQKEPAIIILKMCDQLDNLSTLSIFPHEKYFRILESVVSLYMPFYNRIRKTLPQEYSEIFEQLFYELSARVFDLLNNKNKDISHSRLMKSKKLRIIHRFTTFFKQLGRSFEPDESYIAFRL